MKKIGTLMFLLFLSLTLFACETQEVTEGEDDSNPEYTITFDARGGSLENGNELIIGEGDTVSLPTPVKDNMIFQGWYLSEDYITEFTIDSELDSDMTLVAKWQQATYTITYVVYKNEVMFTEVVNYDEVVQEPVEPQYGGLEFTGWYLSSDFEDPFTFGTLIEEDITLYAKFEEVNENPIDLSGDINITFYHALNQAQQDLLDEMIVSFKALYPDINIFIPHVSLGTYDALHNAIEDSIRFGATPTLIMDYREHLALYNSFDALKPLDDFISHEDYGSTMDDYFDEFLDSGMIDNQLMSLPVYQTSEIIIYNKDLFDYHGITVPTDRAITYDDLESWRDILVGDGPMQVEYLLSIDNPSAFYLNSSYQWGAGYTNIQGDILIGSDDLTTEVMLSYFDARFKDKTIVFPSVLDQSYSSGLFHSGQVAMIQASQGSLQYNIPNDANTVDGKFGLFEIGTAPIIQKEDCVFIQVNAQPGCAASFNGPHIAISSQATDAEALVAWLFMMHITQNENGARLALINNSLPVSESAVTSPLYQDFLYTEYDPDYASNIDYYKAQALFMSVFQSNYYVSEPVFTGPVGPKDVREATERLLYNLYNGSTITEVINNLRSELE